MGAQIEFIPPAGDGAADTPDLQEVTDEGNTTTNDIQVQQIGSGKIKTAALSAAGNFTVIRVTTSNAGTSKSVGFQADVTGATNNVGILYTNNSDAGRGVLTFNNNGGLASNIQWNIRATTNAIEQVAFLSDLSTLISTGPAFNSTFTGQNFTFGHTLPVIPRYVSVTAINEETATAIIGYWVLTITTNTITIRLVNPVLLPIDFQILFICTP